VAKKGVSSFPVEAPLGSGVVTNARHRKPSLSVWEEEADFRDQTAPHLGALSLQKIILVLLHGLHLNQA